MDKQQIQQLYSIIAANYQSQLMKIDSKVYYENMNLFLQDYDYLKVAKNLKEHILKSTYLPQIADLVKLEEKNESVFDRVPNSLETKEKLKQLEYYHQNPISKEELEVIKKEIEAKLKGAKQKYADKRTYNPFD